MKICALVDPFGTSQQEPEDEYAEIKNDFCEILGLDPNKVTFLTDVMPHKLQGTSVDAYVIDYGGMMPGSEDLVRSIFREVINQIEDKPNTLFIIWSKFSFDWYQELIKEESPELIAPNVVFAGDDGAWDKISEWFDIKPPVKHAVKEDEEFG
jgi:hypothetical protein